MTHQSIPRSIPPSTILVIEDDASLRSVIVSTFSRLGYSVSSVKDGAVGLAQFACEPVELVITDIFMPEREGIETIEALKAAAHPPKIVAMSGGGAAGGLDVLDRARHMGADAIIQKPFSLSALIAVAQRLFDEAEAEREARAGRGHGARVRAAARN